MADDLSGLAAAVAGHDAWTSSELWLLHRLAEQGGQTLAAEAALPEGGVPRPSEAMQADCVRAELLRWLCSHAGAHARIERGGIMLAGCRIRGTRAYESQYPGGVLDLSSLKIPFPVILHRCRLPRWVLLQGTDVAFLDLSGCHGGAILADVLKVRGDLYLRCYRASGIVKLPGAAVGGDLELDGAILEPGAPPLLPRDHGVALDAAGIAVTGDVLARVQATGGAVVLDGARVQGDLDCGDAQLENPVESSRPRSGTALSFRGAVVKGHVHLGGTFRASGAVRLPGAQIGGHLDCDHGSFHNPWQAGLAGSGIALEADGAEVRMDVKVSGEPDAQTGFNANGTVSLVGIKVHGHLDRRRGTFTQSPATEKSKKRKWPWSPLAEEPPVLPLRRPALDLRNAEIRYVKFPRRTEKRGPDLKKGDLWLDGFVYSRVVKDPDPNDWKLLHGWVTRQEIYRPQPYVQAAKALRDGGDRAGARRMLIAMEKDRQPIRPMDWPWRLISRATIGYGYRSWYAICWLAAIVAAAAASYSYYGGKQFSMVPTRPAEYNQDWDRYPRFHPVLYSLEASLPLVTLGQADHWRPNPEYEKAGAQRYFNFTTLRATQRLLGWILVTLFVAGLTGLVQRE